MPVRCTLWVTLTNELSSVTHATLVPLRRPFFDPSVHIHRRIGKGHGGLRHISCQIRLNALIREVPSWNCRIMCSLEANAFCQLCWWVRIFLWKCDIPLMPDNVLHKNPLSVPRPVRSIVCRVLQWIDVDICLNCVTDPARWTSERHKWYTEIWVDGVQHNHFFSRWLCTLSWSWSCFLSKSKHY